MEDDSWAMVAANPESLGEVEKKDYLTMKPILNDILDELKANGRIKTIYVRGEWNRLEGLEYQNRETGIAHNLLIALFERPEERSKFFKAVEEFGFKEFNITQIYLTLAVAGVILNTEHFKQLLLFTMKNVDCKMSNFENTIRKFAPENWKRLKPFLDNKFRNALAHGTYAFESPNVVLYEDAELIPFDEMRLDKFMMRAKRQNVLYQCLMRVIVEKKKSGFFT